MAQLFLALAGLIVGASVAVAEVPRQLIVEDFMVDAADPGTQVYVRNKRPADMNQFSSDKTLLFVHGSTLPAEVTFDYSLQGLSWMDYIARHGWDVYLVDVRGYGRSTRPPEMGQPAASNPPIVTTDVAVKDVGSAIDFILQRRGLSKLNLMGWSWGTVITGAYTAEKSEKIESLVLFAPPWLRPPPPSQAASQPLGAYVAAPPSRDRLQAGAPEDRRQDLMPEFETWSAAAIATDPVGSTQSPPVLRSPAGTVQDTRNYWQAGKPYYDPAKIKVPTLVIVGEWDGLTRPDGAQAIFHRLPSGPDKRFVEIGEATHLALLEKNRMELFREVQLFIDRGRQSKARKLSP